jgi:ABC-type glycerol-3-phosphate transport system permease component
MATLATKQVRAPRVRWGSIGTYAAFAVFSLVILVPIYWMVRSAFAVQSQLTKTPLVYLPKPTLTNFEMLIDQVPFLEYTRNSLLFSIGTTTATLVVSFLAAYAFARLRVRGSGVLLWLFLLTMALPDVGTIVPLYRLLSRFSLLDSLTGLTIVLSSTLTPFTVWVLVSFIKQVPYEIEEAAIIDGASLPRILWRIVLPLTAPGLVTMAVINFINAWNNLLYPLSFSVTPASKTLSVSITEVFAGYSPYGCPWELIMAVGVTMMVPVTLLILVSQKAIVRGLTGGALKS